MRCRGCNRSIDVQWKTVDTEDKKYVTFLESLCSTCLLWASLAGDDEKDCTILPVALGEWGDDYAPTPE